VPWLQLPLVAETLERGDRRHWHGGRLLERQVAGLHGDRVPDTDVLGQGAAPAAEDLVPRLNVPDVSADRFHRPGEVDSQSGALRLA